jgi:hypothetical protein
VTRGLGQVTQRFGAEHNSSITNNVGQRVSGANSLRPNRPTVAQMTLRKAMLRALRLTERLTVCNAAEPENVSV